MSDKPRERTVPLPLPQPVVASGRSNGTFTHRSPRFSSSRNNLPQIVTATGKEFHLNGVNLRPYHADNGPFMQKKPMRRSTSHNDVQLPSLSSNPYYMQSSPHPEYSPRTHSPSRQSTAMEWRRRLGLANHNVWLLFLLLAWYCSAIIGTLVNKQMMSDFSFPRTLTAIHLLIGTIVDFVWARNRRMQFFMNRRLFLFIFPVSGTLAFTKVLTYFSYARVPASLTHTVKACSPIINVGLSRLVFGKLPGFYTGLSLIPIVVGVTLSAVTEINFQLVGFLSALVATLSGVCQTTATKTSLSTIKVDPLVFHLYTSLAAFLMTLPFVLYSEGTLLFGVAADADPSVPVFQFPWKFIFTSVVGHYVQNISSIYFLQHVNVLTYIVCNTFKRLFIIIFSVVYFQNPISLYNGLGMAIALCGFLSYGVARSYHNKQTDRSLMKRKKDGDMFLGSAVTPSASTIPTLPSITPASQLMSPHVADAPGVPPFVSISIGKDPDRTR